MKTFNHQNDTNICILRAYDKEFLNAKGQQPILIKAKVDAYFYDEKPEVGDILQSFSFGINEFTITEIIENRDAKTDHWPKKVGGVEYLEDDMKRPEAKGHHFNPEKAFFILQLEKVD